jgi:hypothetical protein
VSYLKIPIELNPETIIQGVYEDMAAAFPGWRPAPGNPETFLIRAVVYRLFAPLAQLAADVPDQIFDKIGTDLVKVQPIPAVAATVASTWTLKDNAGYTIPAGTQVDIAISGDVKIGFATVSDVVVAPGSAITAVGEVILEAIIPGADGNELTDGASLVDALSYVTTIDLVGVSSGGSDAEDPGAYLSRLVETMKTIGPHPVIASDVEILARNIPGVGRALALDNYDPKTDDPDDPGTWNSEKTTSIAVTDLEGQALLKSVKDAVAADFESKREANFAFNVLDADYNSIDVNTEVVVFPGFDQAIVEANVIAALIDFLSPALWGTGNQPDPAIWINTRVIRYQDLSAVVNAVQGCDYWKTLKVAITGKGLGVVDVTMKGAAPLPIPGTIQIAA